MHQLIDTTHHPITNQTVALAGIAQSCSLVHQLAVSGTADMPAQGASLSSILKVDAPSALDVYGGLAGVSYGLNHLRMHLSGKGRQNGAQGGAQARYAAQLMYLQRQLANRPDLSRQIGAGIGKVQAQVEHFGILHPNVQANLADLYQSTLSTIHPRILVVGDQQHLSNQAVANRIRAILLAGVRAAMLWRQYGGSRWRLLFLKGNVLAEAERLLALVESDAGAA